MHPSTVLMVAGFLGLALLFGFVLRPDLIGPVVRQNVWSILVTTIMALLMERVLGPLAALAFLWIVLRCGAGWLHAVDPRRPLGR